MRLTLRQRNARNGYLYILPWVLGMAIFFIPALINVTIYAFSAVDKGNFQLTFIGMDNFYYAIRGDKDFLRHLVSVLQQNAREIPLILIFSYFVALLLKKPFKGSFLVKGIFFLTVILSSDMFITMQNNTQGITDAQTQGVLDNASSFFEVAGGDNLIYMLENFGIPSGIISFITTNVGRITQIFIRSGVQIFIFLAGLSSIPDSMYEASSMEGATQWENFWKITFPMTTPIILVNFVYSVVDTFNTMMSAVMSYIHRIGFVQYNYGLSSAMAIIYFVIMGTFIGLVLLITRKRVFYY